MVERKPVYVTCSNPALLGQSNGISLFFLLPFLFEDFVKSFCSGQMNNSLKREERKVNLSGRHEC